MPNFVPLKNGGFLYDRFDVQPIKPEHGGGHMISFILPDMPLIDLKGKLEQLKEAGDWMTDGLPQTNETPEDYLSAADWCGAERV